MKSSVSNPGTERRQIASPSALPQLAELRRCYANVAELRQRLRALLEALSAEMSSADPVQRRLGAYGRRR